MKGVILAGGKGTRLRPTTKVVNKHVIPIYDQPMIYYPVETLLEAGIDEILVISNAEHIGKYIELLDGEFDAEFTYRVQTEPKGIAHAVSLAEDFVDDSFAAILGDNILFEDLTAEIDSFSGRSADAEVFLKDVDEPSAYGVASVDGGQVVEIKEKPDSPDSNYAVIGLYLYTSDVFDRINDLEPSNRGEYEISDVNDWYASEGSLDYGIIDSKWFDAGTPEGVFQASSYAREEKFEADAP
jgi:glucose-1-phosphate thymidylyltransferase